MQPHEWQAAWEHGLQHASPDEPLLPPACRSFLVTHGLPRVVIFECRSSFEISFAPLARKLVTYQSTVRWGDFFNPERDAAWRLQVVIGTEDFCNGEAAYCVHRETGTISRIDCQLTDPQCFVNSSVAHFGLSLLTAQRWSARLSSAGRTPSPQDYAELAWELERVDEEAFASADAFWPHLVAVMHDEEPIDLEITSDPARSKPRF